MKKLPYFSLVLCFALVFPIQAQQLTTPVPLPTHDQLELRLADATAQHQRSLCANLWQQGNDFEHALKKLQEEHAKLLEEHIKLKKDFADATLGKFETQ